MKINAGIFATGVGDSVTAATVAITAPSTNTKIFIAGVSASMSESGAGIKTFTIKDGGVTKFTGHANGNVPRDITFNPPIECHDSVDGSFAASGVASGVPALNIIYFKA